MKNTRTDTVTSHDFRRKTAVVWMLLAVIFLQGCGSLQMPKVWDMKRTPPAKEYRPLAHDLAVMAAPEGGGRVIHCRLGQGTARFGTSYLDFQTASFSLAEAQRGNITLTSARGAQAQLQGIYDRAGQKLIFCPVRTGAPDQQIACNSLYALDDDLAMGIRRTFDIPDAVTGSVIVCGQDAGRLPPLHE